MAELPTGTVTFLFTDIEGSTALWERDRTTMRSAVERQLAILQSIIEAHHGVLYKQIGDGTQAAFPTAEDGVRAALDVQRALLAEPGPTPPGRCGSGWLCMSATPSRRTATTSPRRSTGLPGSSTRRTAGRCSSAKPLPASCVMRCRRVSPSKPSANSGCETSWSRRRSSSSLTRRCAATFPPLNTPGQLPHNLPIHPTPFLGREREVEEITNLLLRPDVRLVTLTGPGGVGKTRLGLRVAAGTLESFPDGAFLVDLARQTDPDLVPSAAATALGLREQPGQTLPETLAAHLRDKCTCSSTSTTSSTSCPRLRWWPICWPRRRS